MTESPSSRIIIDVHTHRDTDTNTNRVSYTGVTLPTLHAERFLEQHGHDLHSILADLDDDTNGENGGRVAITETEWNWIETY